ncbi:hypothetical protein [Neobacillus sp. NPDC093127]|uniref:hypothetical protein n=1 Tax=Neobacillus sp. NPDC093127 TaxID=3364296 RepID=UPI0037F31975
MGETQVSKKRLQSNFLLLLNRHHQSLFLYGLIQIAAAVIISSLSWTTKEQLILPETKEVFSHPTLIVLFIAVLLINAMVFALIGATYGALWFRLGITSIVAILLLVFGWRIGAFSFIVLPVVFIVGYVIWRGSRPIADRPTVKDLVILYSIMIIGWFLVVVFGIRVKDMSIFVTLYFGISQLLVFASILPIPQILMSGVDLADLTHTVVERITSLCARMGNHGVIVALLATSMVKVGFIVWNGGLSSFSSWIMPGIFLLCFVCIVLFCPKQLLDFKPQFKHWLFLTGFIFPIPIGFFLIFVMLGGYVSTDSVGPLLIAGIGPIGLILSGVLAFFPKKRPFSIFIMLMAIWALLTFSFDPLCKLIFGTGMKGLNLWDLDGIAATFFILWSIWLLYQRKSSTLLATALKFSLFLSGCFLLDQMLNQQFAIAELYSVFQILTYLAIYQFIASPKHLRWSQVLLWLVSIVLLVHCIWIKIFPDGLINIIMIMILIVSMLWDVLIADEKITGKKVNGSYRLGLLFLYLGVATWTIAQIVFAKTGKGTAVLEWEPLLLLGLFVVGMPWVFYSFLIEIKTKLGADPQ